jgi:mono/diheme cytochrome c family protein
MIGVVGILSMDGRPTREQNMIGLKASNLWAGVALAFALGPATTAAQEAAAAPEPDGAALYDSNCKSCHGPAGGAPSPAMMGMMENLTSITDAAFLHATPDDSLVSVTQTGRGKMKPFADRLSQEEILAIVKFLRSFEAPDAGQEVPVAAEPPPAPIEEEPAPQESQR